MALGLLHLLLLPVLKDQDLNIIKVEIRILNLHKHSNSVTCSLIFSRRNEDNNLIRKKDFECKLKRLIKNKIKVFD